MVKQRLIGVRQGQVKTALAQAHIDAAVLAQEKASRAIVGALNCHRLRLGFSSLRAGGA
jgi:hypothetical protein